MPHVRWDAGRDRKTLWERYLGEESHDLLPYIVYYLSKPIGYIQSYKAYNAANGWWPDEKEGTVGIDIFIGEPEYLGKGLGTKIVKLFVEKLFADATIKKIVVDPKPDNFIAINCYKNAGFKEAELITTPDGPALLMYICKK